MQSQQHKSIQFKLSQPSSHTVSLTAAALQNGFQIHYEGSYFPYNEHVVDVGWGCAWRAIQTLLSCRGFEISFEQLYKIYSERSKLFSITATLPNYQEMLQDLNSKKWVPAEISSHWAEPFIASLICRDLSIPHSLLLLNGFPMANAPRSALGNPLTFTQLLPLLCESLTKNTVMIDDGQYALSIVAIKELENGELAMMVADPHIRSNVKDSMIGLYVVRLSKNGSQVGHLLSSNQQEQALYSVYSKLTFSQKFWMICMIS